MAYNLSVLLPSSFGKSFFKKLPQTNSQIQTLYSLLGGNLMRICKQQKEV